MQGPLGGQSVPGLQVEESYLLRDIDYEDNGNEQSKISTLSWEAAIHRHVEELYGPSAEVSDMTFFIFNQLVTFSHIYPYPFQWNGFRDQDLDMSITYTVDAPWRLLYISYL